MTRLDVLRHYQMSNGQQGMLGWNFAVAHTFLEMFAKLQRKEAQPVFEILDRVALERTAPLNISYLTVASDYLYGAYRWSASVAPEGRPLDERYTRTLECLGIVREPSLIKIQEKAVEHMLEHYDTLLSCGSYPQPCSTCIALDAFYKSEA